MFRTTAQRQQEATVVSASARRFKEQVQQAFAILFAPILREGETMPDLSLLQELIGRHLDSSSSAVVEIDGYSVATALDAELLRGVARRSGGTYFAAADTASLERLHERIDLKLTTVGRNTEITAIFAGGALVLLLVAAGLSMRWYGRVI